MPEKFTALALPLALLLTTYAFFYFAGKFLGKKKGYLAGFLFYWLFWCLLIPGLLLPRQAMISLFSFNFSLTPLDYFCLLLPLVFAYAYAFPKALSSVTIQIIGVSLLLAVVNAPLEELLWRGLYLHLFGSGQWLYLIISSAGFAVWHLAPQVIFPNKAPGGQLSFVLFAFVLGILFGIATWHTHSIVPTVICHILFDFSGLGGRLYLT